MRIGIYTWESGSNVATQAIAAIIGGRKEDDWCLLIQSDKATFFFVHRTARGRTSKATDQRNQMSVSMCFSARHQYGWDLHAAQGSCSLYLEADCIDGTQISLGSNGSKNLRYARRIWIG